ncbi:cupin domain-containing protein [Pseudonocardia spinosispora]|uniref:cupin domain-containing protein n=1 Tax=Pseudonocardia spinosispora TaxID=103441 RepID=UPI000423FC29|nr:cupin domain-containing protein [Pseudonocardia spinosispora]
MAYEGAGVGAFEHVLHGGSPVRMQWYFREESRLPVAFQTWEFPPGGWEGEHTHRSDQPLDELYLLLQGSAEMTVSGVRHSLGPGDAVLAPAGVPHDFRNTGSGPAKVLVVWGPPGAPVDWTAFGSGRAAAAEAG